MPAFSPESFVEFIGFFVGNIPAFFDFLVVNTRAGALDAMLGISCELITDLESQISFNNG